MLISAGVEFNLSNGTPRTRPPPHCAYGPRRRAWRLLRVIRLADGEVAFRGGNNRPVRSVGSDDA